MIRIAQVASLDDAFIEAIAPDVFAGSFEMPMDALREVLSTSEATFVGYVDGEPVGFSEATRNVISLYRATVSAAVLKPHHGNGYGPLLLAAALGWCDENGIEYVDGWAWADNERALKMDARQGFKIVGRINDAFRRGDGSSRDQVLMVRGG